jgi:hypothetical protein
MVHQKRKGKLSQGDAMPIIGLYLVRREITITGARASPKHGESAIKPPDYRT